MARLFGEELSGEQLRQRVGCLSQVAGASPFRLAGGRADGVRAVGVRTGSGLSFVVLLDRGLDIAHAEYCGQPIGWISKSGIAAPAYFEPVAGKSTPCWPEFQVERQEGNRCPTDTAEKSFA